MKKEKKSKKSLRNQLVAKATTQMMQITMVNHVTNRAERNVRMVNHMVINRMMHHRFSVMSQRMTTRMVQHLVVHRRKDRPLSGSEN